jgi:hypothetical protein
MKFVNVIIIANFLSPIHISALFTIVGLTVNILSSVIIGLDHLATLVVTGTLSLYLRTPSPSLGQCVLPE